MGRIRNPEPIGVIEPADTAKETGIRVAVHYCSAADSAQRTADEWKQRRQTTLTQRADDPQAIADAVRYLSESPFITGQ
jgi:hypothetical protein